MAHRRHRRDGIRTCSFFGQTHRVGFFRGGGLGSRPRAPYGTPPWGRPPRGIDARSKREWERQAREWEERGRFEELDSEEDDEGSRAGHDEYAYGEEDDDIDDFDDPGEEWQLAMREKEDELAERAMRRIRRARIRGESNVDLSREELDALEKRRYREEASRRPTRKPLPAPRQPLASIEAPLSKSKRKSSSNTLGNGASSKSKGSSKGSKTTMSVPVTDYSPTTSPTELHTGTGYFPRSTHVSPRASRVSSRTSLNARLPQSQLQLTANDLSASSHRPSSSRSSARRPDVSPTRSLPDDPDWIPGRRSRSSSSAQLYKPNSHSPPPPLPSGPDPYAYQTGGSGYGPGRRIVSDPSLPGVSYPSVRRNPLASNRGSAGTSGLGREVIEVSSDDDGVDEEDESSDDEGVRVDVVPDDEEGNGYSMAVARPPANAARSRKSKR